MIFVERFIGKEYIHIGWYECLERCSWIYTVYEYKNAIETKGYPDEIICQGCATSRRDAIAEIRSEFRESEKECLTNLKQPKETKEN